jgi:hypothetical protein
MSELNLVNQTVKPICTYLRSKGMYVNATMEPVEDEASGYGDGYFWCLKSLHQFGPDNDVVNRNTCNPSRRCFEAM